MGVGSMGGGVLWKSVVMCGRGGLPRAAWR